MKKVYLSFKGQTIIFLSGGLPFLGLADNFFKSNLFQTIFFITFCNENNFLRSFLKNITGFFMSYLKKALPVHAYMHTHEKSHLNETNSP